MDKQPRVLVCVTGQKSCERLIREGALIARDMGAELTVVHVAKTGDNFLGSASESQALEYLFDISKHYDADMVLLRSSDVVGTIASHARKTGSRLLLMGVGAQKDGGYFARALQNALPDVEIRTLMGVDE